MNNEQNVTFLPTLSLSLSLSQNFTALMEEDKLAAIPHNDPK